jgi:hypothetical protein
MVDNSKELTMLKVQIAIAGNYAENYALDDWNGEGQCPYSWKQKGSYAEIIVSDVPFDQIASVINEIKADLDGYGYSNNASRWAPDSVYAVPNKLADRELVDFDFGAYIEIKSISQEDIQEFLRVMREE